MFIRKELIKKINELYFKTYRFSDEELISFKDYNSEEINKNIKVLLRLNLVNSEFYLMHVDLLNYNEGIFKSDIAIRLNNTRKVYSEKVKNSIPYSCIREVIDILKGLSPNSCLVGGAVRDAILGSRSQDFDFCTDTNYSVLKEEFEKNGFIVKETGKEFLVMNIIKNSETFEIANFRKDGEYLDSRRPESVQIGTIDEDAHRRDFTINSLYFRLIDEQLLDPTGYGVPDIKDRTLRFVGNPEDRLREDSIRGWRFYRFISKGFVPAAKDLKAVRTLFKSFYETSNPARVQQEIEKLVQLQGK